jgi:hypothetical protein
MIEHNLGAFERAVRLLVGTVLGVWALAQSELGIVEWITLLAATLLILNGIFGRCYLWLLLGMDTCGRGAGVCKRRAGRTGAGGDGAAMR